MLQRNEPERAVCGVFKKGLFLCPAPTEVGSNPELLSPEGREFFLNTSSLLPNLFGITLH
jgi:hypothetical protein